VDGATTLLLGDVSFLHDLNGLQLASLASGSLVIVVVNNGGGRIFDQLPIARDGKEAWLRYFTTPHDADLESAALVYGCEFHSTDTVTGFRRALDLGYARKGCTVIEAVVPPQSALHQGLDLVARVQGTLRPEAS
jgi:2-succinyl-5-enolpyruvyl-6-hydroxy-3-cyclohexene-1-carboxylate synthase